MSDLICAEELQEFVGDELEYDKEFTWKLFATFEKYVGEFIAIGFTGEAQNLDEIGRSAHKLKSSSGSFGAKALAGLLGEVEESAGQVNHEKTQEFYLKAQEIAGKTVVSLKDRLNVLLERGQQSA